MKILNDQYFTYRQTPVDYDGVARPSIKGNTVVWNQLVQNGNFADATNWTGVRGTVAVSSNVLTYTCTEVGTNLVNNRIYQLISGMVTGHNYIVSLSVNVPRASLFVFQINGVSEPTWKYQKNISTGWNEVNFVYNADVSSYNATSPMWVCVDMHSGTGYSVNDTVQFKNINVIDMTKLSDSRVTDYASFRSYYPLVFYPYDTGSLLNFNGNGMKSVGKNELDPTLFRKSGTDIGITIENTNGSISFSGTSTVTSASAIRISETPFMLRKGFKYYFAGNWSDGHSPTTSNLRIDLRTNLSTILAHETTGYYTPTEDIYVYVYTRVPASYVVPTGLYANPVVTLSTDTSYEPYKSTTESLPISSYFPTGMKSAESIYDELSDKAITRVGSVDLGSLTWTKNAGEGSTYHFRSDGIASLVAKPSATNVKANLTCSKYENVSSDHVWVGTQGIAIRNTNGYIWVYDSSLESGTADAFKSAMSGVYLNYELATYTEQDVDPIYYNFYGNGTEELLPSALMNGVVDLANLTWTYSAQYNRFETTSLRASIKGLTKNVVSSIYENDNTIWVADGNDKGMGVNGNGDLFVRNLAYNDVTSFKNAMNGVYLWYEKSTSEPTTSPLLADIIYYNLTDSEVPYRVFWAINSKGERWDFTEREFKSFMNNPQGLGFSKTISVNRYGNVQNLTDITDNFPQPNGEILFYDSHNSTRYDKYNQFVKFLSYEPITLYYKIPVSFYSRIPNTYSLECVVGTLTKTESKTDNMMNCSITYNALSFYKGEEVEISGTGTSYTINNDSDFPIGFEITITGSPVNPYFTLTQDGEMYGEAKFTDSTAFSSVYVNSNDGEQNVELQQGGSVLPNPLSYQDLSISNGSIYVTFVKLARGESTLTIGKDSGSITGVDIVFTPIYRSV